VNRLNGWTIRLYRDDSGTLTLLDSTITGSDTTLGTTYVGPVGNGQYRFVNLPNATYVVCNESRSGWMQTRPDPASTTNSVTNSQVDPLNPDEYCYRVVVNDSSDELKGKQFGVIEQAEIRVHKVYDVNEDGLPGWEAPENHQPGWTIRLYKDTGADWMYQDSVVTTGLVYSNSAKFLVDPGNYVLCEVMQFGYKQSFARTIEGWVVWPDYSIPNTSGATDEGEKCIPVTANTGEITSYVFGNIYDNDAPYVKIHQPKTYVSGNQKIKATISDDNPHHYWLAIQLSGGGPNLGPGVVNDSSSIIKQNIFTWNTLGLTNGDSYIIKLEARDALGNKDPNLAPVPSDPEDPNDSVDWITVIVDNEMPTITIDSVNGDTDLTDGAGPIGGNFAVKGTAGDSISGIARVRVRIRHIATGHVYNFRSDDGSGKLIYSAGTWQLDLTPSDLPDGDGEYDIAARSVDNADNKANTSVFAPVIIDNTAPVVTVDTLSTLVTSPSLTGTVDDPTAVVNVTVNGNTYIATNNGGGTWSLTAGVISPSLGAGIYEVTATATDTAGNSADDSTANELTINELPTTVTITQNEDNGNGGDGGGQVLAVQTTNAFGGDGGGQVLGTDTSENDDQNDSSRDDSGAGNVLAETEDNSNESVAQAQNDSNAGILDWIFKNWWWLLLAFGGLMLLFFILYRRDEDEEDKK
ncbi:hypothetical protein KDA00_02275, partial [Candidatus Saccharibacteria bacterium]|nr:hypothetical protein [Candidatus Saccharibacteria bacterium]